MGEAAVTRAIRGFMITNQRGLFNQRGLWV
jgi:hypothetical protein